MDKLKTFNSRLFHNFSTHFNGGKKTWAISETFVNFLKSFEEKMSFYGFRRSLNG